jgi:hypothetical protein
MNVFLLLACLLVISLLQVNALGGGGGGVPGGWSPVRVDDNEVRDATSFAVREKYPKHTVYFQVLEASKQVPNAFNNFIRFHSWYVCMFFFFL